MNFKYSEELEKLSIQCPPESYEAKDLKAFRWVFDDINDKRNFTPRYYLAPKRDIIRLEQIENIEKRDKKKCNYFSLSMFSNGKKINW